MSKSSDDVADEVLAFPTLFPSEPVQILVSFSSAHISGVLFIARSQLMLLYAPPDVLSILALSVAPGCQLHYYSRPLPIFALPPLCVPPYLSLPAFAHLLLKPLPILLTLHFSKTTTDGGRTFIHARSPVILEKVFSNPKRDIRSWM